MALPAPVAMPVKPVQLALTAPAVIPVIPGLNAIAATPAPAPLAVSQLATMPAAKIAA